MTSAVRLISPSQRWNGSDGPWSSFVINVGNPPKTLFVLPSTSGRSTWVVLPEGCEQQGDPADCDALRGGVFDPNKSTTFSPELPPDGQQYFSLNFGPEQPLNSLLPQDQAYNGGAEVGNDTLRFGFSSDDAPTLENQLIVGFAVNVPFLGLLGLSAWNETIASFQDVHPSVIAALRDMDAIPSRSWGYTAGAQYRNTYGSLTFGGYDSSRGNVDNVLTVSMQEDVTRDLVIQIQQTTLGYNSQNHSISTEPIPVFIDSVVPEIWLPQNICASFEETFGLVWNDTVEMYLVDDELHNQLTDGDASVTFSLIANSTTNSSDTIDITMPYAAFNLTAAYPLLEALYPGNATATLRYFPLKRANETDQYYLGRTFLQEAYIAADYENRVFNVSQATFDSPESDLVAILAPSSKSSSLSTGDIVGIVIGVLGALALVGGLLWWFWWRKRKGKKSKRRGTMGSSSIGDNTTIAEWNNNVPMQQVEQYKPSEVSGEELDRFKPELDATVTARGIPNERHELWAGSVRRPSDQSRASISPLEERHRVSRMSHQRTISGNSFGQPSPPMSDHPSPPLPGSGRDSPFGQPSPPTAADQDRSWFGGTPVFYELHGRSRDSPRSPSSPVRTPGEGPLLGDHASNHSGRGTRQSGFVEEFDLRPQPDGDRS